METQRASLSLGRWSLWLLLLGLVLPSASAQALSYREAMLRAVDQLNERSSEDMSWGGDRGRPVNFRVKETVCPRSNLQPPEQCDFKENGLVKQCVGTLSLYRSDDPFGLNCNELQSVRRLHPQHQRFPRERPWPKPLSLPLPRPGPRPWPKPLLALWPRPMPSPRPFLLTSLIPRCP
uniref:Uncharacterized protein n=1 Tax=Bos taurus TaxID=9913 RepID=G8JKZ9_BOVIN